MRALYVGYSKDTENHGDEALLWIIRDLLAPELDVRPDWKEFDVAVLGGGTLINQSPWLIDYFASALDRADGRGIVVGTGVGDIAFWGDHFDKWIPLLKRCAAVGVRGEESQRLLSQHGYRDADVCGDPYLWIQTPIRRETLIPKRLGVNVGSTNNSLWGTNDNDLQEVVRDVLTRLAADGWTFSFVSVWSKDVPIAEQLAEYLAEQTGQRPQCLDARTQTLEAYSALAGCELFVGEKLHACAMAAVAGIPFVALEYQPKVRDFTESLQMHDWTISTANLTADALVKKIESAYVSRVATKQQLITHCDNLRWELLAFVTRAKSQLLYPDAHKI